MLDGAPIVVVATGFASGSANAKTGAGLIQTWILRDDVSPIEAVNSGADASICGDCQHRGRLEHGRNVARSCYVTVFQAPNNIWKTVQRGSYSVAANLSALFKGRKIRFGAYGDPAAVPLGVLSAMADQATGWTGYTHQWERFPELAPYCMASCDSPSERAAARVLGFRTFRVSLEPGAMDKLEVVCPASAEAGHKTTCDACMACGGTSARARADIVIAVHGATGKVAAMVARS
jgi:hypothetical protein